MKKLLFLPLFLLLSGCVSYYTPTAAIEDGVYYAEDDPAYNNTSYVYNYDSYYPWASMDYFYLGASPFYPAYRYPAYRYGYGGYVGSGFSIGFSTWYTPYYGYYSPYAYYSPWYGYHYPRYGYAHYKGRYGYGNGHYGKGHYGKGHNGNNRGNNGDQYAGNNRGDRNRNRYRDRDNANQGDAGSGNYNGNRRNRGAADNEDYARQGNGKGDHRGRNSTTNPNERKNIRYVSTSPTSEAGNKGMVVRSGGSKEPQKGRTHQNNRYRAVPSSPTQVEPAASDPSSNGRSLNRGSVSTTPSNGRGSNKYRSRTMPVEPVRGSQSENGANNVGATSGQLSQRAYNTRNYRSNSGNPAVVQSGSDKQGRSRTTPVRGNQRTVAAPQQQQAANVSRPAVVQAPARQSSGKASRNANRQARASTSRSDNGRSGKRKNRDRD